MVKPSILCRVGKGSDLWAGHYLWCLSLLCAGLIAKLLCRRDGTRVGPLSLGIGEDPLEEGMAAHSSIHA